MFSVICDIDKACVSEVSQMTENSARSKKKTTTMPRAPYLDNRQLALRIQGEGFKVVKDEVGDRLNAIRASRIVEILRDNGYEDKDIDKDLLAAAARKRPGHKGGPVKPPVDGEVRVYTASKGGRIGLPLNVIGKKNGDKVKVKFSRSAIKVMP